MFFVIFYFYNFFIDCWVLYCLTIVYTAHVMHLLLNVSLCLSLELCSVMIQLWSFHLVVAEVTCVYMCLCVGTA